MVQWIGNSLKMVVKYGQIVLVCVCAMVKDHIGEWLSIHVHGVCIPIIKNPITGWRSYPIFITCLGSQSLDCLQLFKHEYGDLHNTWVQWEFQDPKMEVLYHFSGHILWGYSLT